MDCGKENSELKLLFTLWLKHKQEWMINFEIDKFWNWREESCCMWIRIINFILVVFKKLFFLSPGFIFIWTSKRLSENFFEDWHYYICIINFLHVYCFALFIWPHFETSLTYSTPVPMVNISRWLMADLQPPVTPWILQHQIFHVNWAQRDTVHLMGYNTFEMHFLAIIHVGQNIIWTSKEPIKGKQPSTACTLYVAMFSIHHNSVIMTINWAVQMLI